MKRPLPLTDIKTWLSTLGFVALSAWVFFQTRAKEPQALGSSGIETKNERQTDRSAGKASSTSPGIFHIVRVHDGDTCDVIGSDGIRITIRLSGIDAPELAQAFGHEARQMLVELVENNAISLSEVGRDKYGRFLAQVYCDGTSINREMLIRGGAWAYLAGNQFDDFKKIEGEAKTKRLGLWASKDAKPPWEARR